MKLGKKTIPDYLTTDEGAVIRTVDLVTKIRGEFRDIERLLAISNASTLLVTVKVCHIMRTQYKHTYMHLNAMPIFQAIHAFHVITRRRDFKISELYDMFPSGLNFWYFRISVSRYLHSGYYHKPLPGVIRVDEQLISAMNIFNKVYLEELEKNKEILLSKLT